MCSHEGIGDARMLTGMAPSHCRPPPVPCRLSSAPQCSHDGIGACLHASCRRDGSPHCRHFASADCACLPPCSHDGMGACPHASRLTSHWRPPPASCRLCCRAAVFARRQASMLAYQPLPEYSPAVGLPPSCANRVVMPPCSHDGIGACLHINHCWNGIPLLRASPFLVRIVSSCHRVNTTA